MRRWTALLLMGTSLFATFHARADIYRYVDDAGVEHYTNFQQRDGRAKRIYHAKNARLSARAGRETAGPLDPARVALYNDHIREAARIYVLPEEFIRAVMHVESNFNQYARSDKGALGLMQLMPSTAVEMGVDDPFDPRQNVLGGTRYLRVLANRFAGDPELTLAAYNAGEAAVRKYGGIPPFVETQSYVRRVLAQYDLYKTQHRDAATIAQR